MKSSNKILFSFFLIASLSAAEGPLLHSAQSEDWSKPSLSGRRLKAELPVIAEQAAYDGHTYEFVQVGWRSADPIYLYVLLPKGKKNPPVILYLYSYPTETDRFTNESYGKFLVKDGFAAVGFVSALTGQRYHGRPMKEWFVSELDESLGSTVHDVQMILDYLTLRGDVDMTKVGMFGEGSGATIALLSAAVDSRIKALDLVDPWADWPQWLAHSRVVPEEERAGFLKPVFLKRVAALDPVRWFGRVKCPVRVQYLLEPSPNPTLTRERLKKAAPPQANFIPDKEAISRYKSEKLRFFDWIKAELAARTQ